MLCAIPITKQIKGPKVKLLPRCLSIAWYELVLKIQTKWEVVIRAIGRSTFFHCTGYGIMCGDYLRGGRLEVGDSFFFPFLIRLRGDWRCPELWLHIYGCRFPPLALFTNKIDGARDFWCSLLPRYSWDMHGWMEVLELSVWCQFGYLGWDL